jgi:hypothetical protein
MMKAMTKMNTAKEYKIYSFLLLREENLKSDKNITNKNHPMKQNLKKFLTQGELYSIINR